MLYRRQVTNDLPTFLNFCKSRRIELNEQQHRIAEQLFNIPKTEGKTTLIALLFASDASAKKVLNNLCSL